MRRLGDVPGASDEEARTDYRPLKMTHITVMAGAITSGATSGDAAVGLRGEEVECPLNSFEQ